MNKVESYTARKFDLSNLNGISDQTLEVHFKLYEGYVKNTNTLMERLAPFVENGPVDDKEMPAYSELKRRLGFEMNGMVLHEYYFGNLVRGGGGDPAGDSAFRRAAEESYGSYERWRADFTSVGRMRGVGWAICYADARGRVTNHWIDLHETNNVAGYRPVLVMDVWEHAFLLDYKPAERPKYIEAFLGNVDWRAVESRL